MIPKFRAWDKRRKEMWKVATLHIEDEYADLFKTNIYEKPFDNPWAKFEDLIFLQSTGLKDKNGVEIFEGDVVVGQQHLTTDSSTPFEIKGLVRYSKRNTMFYLDEKSFGHDKFMNSLGSSIYQFEVIGNVWEDGDLINDGKGAEEN